MGKRRGFSFGGGGSNTSLSLIHPEALYDIDFARGQWYGALPSNLVVARASTALTLASAAGPYITHPQDTARITGSGLMIEEARTNSIRNPRGSGAVAGSPGTAPTNWSVPVNPLPGVAREVVGLFSVGGLPVIRMRWSGTPSATSSFVALVTFDATTQTAAAISQTWTTSASVALSGGSVSGITPVLLDISERDGAGAGLVNSNTTISLTSSLTRFFHSRTLTNAGTAFVISRLVVSFTSGVAVDFTLDIAAPQLSQAAFALSPILNADGVTSSTTIRPADVVYLPISGVGTEYTMFAETPVLASHVSNTGFVVEARASEANRANIRVGQTINGGVIKTAGVSRGYPELTAGSGVARKIAIRVKGGDIRMGCNGALGTVDTGAAPAVAPNRLYFGREADWQNFLNDFIRRIAVIPRALSDAELEAITT